MDLVSVAVAANLAALVVNAFFATLSMRRIRKYERKLEECSDAEYKAIAAAKEYMRAMALIRSQEA